MMAATYNQGAGAEREPVEPWNLEDEPQTSPGSSRAASVEERDNTAEADEMSSVSQEHGSLETPAKRATAAVFSTLSGAARVFDARLRKEVGEHPYRSLVAAAAVGFLLHQGVKSRAGRFALLAGGRYALKAFSESLMSREVLRAAPRRRRPPAGRPLAPPTLNPTTPASGRVKEHDTMDIKDLKNTLRLVNAFVNHLSADDMLGYVGLQRRRSAMDYVLPAVGLFGTGIAVGVGLGIALAPKTGAEMREDVREGVKKGVHELRERVTQTTAGANGSTLGMQHS
jgi:hypothetical protein